MSHETAEPYRATQVAVVASEAELRRWGYDVNDRDLPLLGQPSDAELYTRRVDDSPSAYVIRTVFDGNLPPVRFI